MNMDYSTCYDLLTPEQFRIFWLVCSKLTALRRLSTHVNGICKSKFREGHIDTTHTPLAIIGYILTSWFPIKELRLDCASFSDLLALTVVPSLSQLELVQLRLPLSKDGLCGGIRKMMRPHVTRIYGATEALKHFTKLRSLHLIMGLVPPLVNLDPTTSWIMFEPDPNPRRLTGFNFPRNMITSRLCHVAGEEQLNDLLVAGVPVLTALHLSNVLLIGRWVNVLKVLARLPRLEKLYLAFLRQIPQNGVLTQYFHFLPGHDILDSKGKEVKHLLNSCIEWLESQGH
jgi:hypothetical protein